MLDKLKRAGFNWLAFGIEAASDRVLSRRRQALRDRRRSTTRSDRSRTAGINIIGNYIFGLPEDDLDTMQETLDLAIELKLRVRQLLFGDGLPGLAAVSTRRSRNGWPLPADLERLLPARRGHPAAADQAPAGRRGAAVPRPCLQDILRGQVISVGTSSAGSAPTRSRISARCRRTSSNASSPLPERPWNARHAVYVAGADTLIGARDRDCPSSGWL